MKRERVQKDVGVESTRKRVSDMRLVNVDALADELFKHHVHDLDGLEPLVYFDDVCKLIDSAQTVDAIPVNWLCEYSGNHFDATGREVTVLEALRQWKNERGGDVK